MKQQHVTITSDSGLYRTNKTVELREDYRGVMEKVGNHVSFEPIVEEVYERKEQTVHIPKKLLDEAVITYRNFWIGEIDMMLDGYQITIGDNTYNVIRSDFGATDILEDIMAGGSQ